MKTTLTKDRISITFDYDPDKTAACKKIGMRFSKSKKVWFCKNTLLRRRLVERNLGVDLDTDSGALLQTTFWEPWAGLMDHQKSGVEIAKTNDRWGFWWDMGTGKTLFGLELIKMFNAKTLVICPLSVIEQAWIKDISKFNYEFSYINSWKARKKPKTYEDQVKSAQVVVCNFESFKAQRPLFETLNFDMVLIDESSKIKSHKSQIFKQLSAFCENIKHVYLFSGTPAPNNNMEYWSQCSLVDPSVLSFSFYKFREEYFYPTGYGGYKWIPHRHMESVLLDNLASMSSVVTREEVLDLPGITYNIRDVELCAEEKRAYSEMKKELIVELGDSTISASTAAVKIMKLRQVTSGFLFDEFNVIHNLGNSKLNVLKDLLEEIGDKQVIIWTQFQYEGKILDKELNKKSIAVRVDGTISCKDHHINMFKNKEAQYLIMHPRSGGHGIDGLQDVCHYCVYYSMSYSPEEFSQSAGRLARNGQENPMTFYFLQAPGIDQVIYKAVLDKKEGEQEVFNYIRNATKLKGRFDR